MQGRRDTTTSTRVLAALGFSLSCHAAALLALTLVPGTVRSPFADRAIVVSVVGDDGGAAGANAPGAEAPAGAAEPESAPPVSAPPAIAHAPRQAHGRTAARVPARAVDSAPPDAPTADDATRIASHDEAGAEAASGVHGSVDAGADGAYGNVAGGDEIAGSGRAHGDGLGGGGGGGGDLRARCTVCPTPEYPARARRQGWQGTVDVQLRVGHDGAVEQASIGRSSGFAVLDAAAVTVARRSRFHVGDGAEIHGQLRYRFVLEGAQDRPL